MKHELNMNDLAEEVILGVRHAMSATFKEVLGPDAALLSGRGMMELSIFPVVGLGPNGRYFLGVEKASLL